MNIVKAEIKYFRKDGFDSVSNENIQHVKVLPYLSIVQSVEGSYDIALGSGKMEHTGDGGFFIAPSGIQQTIVHHVNKESGKMRCRWIFIDVEINNAHRLDALYSFPTVITDDKKAEFHRIFERLFATDNIWENYSDCYKLLGCLLEIATPAKKEPHEGIQNVIAYITEHYAEQITIKMLANRSNLSESNFFTVFKKQMGDSPIAYLNHYRLSIAADRLIETEKTVSEISYSVGINDALYFSKLFKKTYGMSPKKYRSVYRSQK